MAFALLINIGDSAFSVAVDEESEKSSVVVVKTRLTKASAIAAVDGFPTG
jgi:hypothetical protein